MTDTTQTMAADLLISEMTVGKRFKIGVVTLNAPTKLNALSLSMVEGLGAQLRIWANDKKIAAVWLQGAGDKAFCAGGDIVDMYHAMVATPHTVQAEVCHFFTQEYQTDHLIHTFPKPVIVWGDGIVMGGGIGLMVGGSHRLVTERSRLAMPEISIGLYPDVAGSWFLPKMPDNAGLFLGLTGAQINGRDAVHLNMADHRVSSAKQTQLKAGLANLSWQGDNHDFAMLSDFFRDHELSIKDKDVALPEGYLSHQQTVSDLCAGESLQQVAAAILNQDADDPWLQRAQANLRAGSPNTAHLIWQMIQQPPADLASAFRQELGMSCRCAESGEFAEGVRALLIDKDRKPQWQFADVNQVPESVVRHHFSSPWPADVHPLRSLGH
ncbi:enoyl-CoA hydratase/isomerase family protein [Corallincola spongiicola]|nr:enoyl-CoA hydratase/isomerase family protein [Corallincola spongiicola]